jgi:hypothetical protein
MKSFSRHNRFRISQTRALELVLLLAVMTILLSLSCSSRSGDLVPSGSPFEIVRGREKVHLLTYGKMLGLGDPRVYTTPGNKREIFLTEVLPDYTYAPGFVWKPVREMRLYLIRICVAQKREFMSLGIKSMRSLFHCLL